MTMPERSERPAVDRIFGESALDLDALSRRVTADPDKVERGLVQLVLTLVELLRQLMERQAIRRLDAGALTEAETERRLFARIDAGEDVSPAEIARGRFFGGAPGDVIEGIEACRAQTGITHISVGFGGGLMGRSTDAAASEEVYDETREQITRFGREVMPAFAVSPS